MHINDGGVLRRVRQIYVNDGGVLRRVWNIYMNDGGVLRRERLGDILQLSGGNISDTVIGAEAQATYRIEDDAEERSVTNSGGDVLIGNWVIPASRASAYECRLTGTGTTPDGEALNTWLALSITRIWSLTRSTPGGVSFSGTLDVGFLGANSALVSAPLQLAANFEP